MMAEAGAVGGAKENHKEAKRERESGESISDVFSLDFLALAFVFALVASDVMPLNSAVDLLSAYRASVGT